MGQPLGVVGGGRRGGDPRSYGRARRFIRALPPLVIVGGVVFDLLTPAKYSAAPLFSAAPLIAAPFFSTLTTLLTGIAAVLASLGLHVYNETALEISSLTEVLTVLTVSALALLINRVVRRSGERLASARVIAETAQKAVLPTPAERIGGLHCAARYEAAQADAFIGGDLFAVQDTPFGVRLVVGDVRGKGMEAVEAVAVVIGAFREAAEQERTLEGVAGRLERALAREGTRRDGLDAFEGFTTAVLAEIPRGDGGGTFDGFVRVVNRGHPPPLMLYADGRLDTMDPGEAALPLGMGDLAAWPDRAEARPYPPGATLLFYTDGLSEARNAEGVFYDPGQRLAGRIFPGPEELLDALVDDVRLHTGGGSTDDMALLAVSRPATGQPERRRTMPVVPPGGR
ncbi:PP2C family protein-serine/threonine phosphatase [Streptomyces venezuelae]|uniref:Serine phosphatase RsbU, regulator of sigma subunit n=1 Tax=Streptomyces venezuelae (strain ATCC 10712 / CBS 650.69 / DSM 40230 / JCM 4526 / NBRC 13096 / PD 04745) TaxID=953739 RepID=F2REM5_STRVP|nr:serine/threonine-protein phosphatase [Streptomyces venezuelae]CCA57148.1 Serine phosphatase RsbU, regulator of sigma subunit [Streptomyces venezuelae ATCC 10712]